MPKVAAKTGYGCVRNRRELIYIGSQGGTEALRFISLTLRCICERNSVCTKEYDDGD